VERARSAARCPVPISSTSASLCRIFTRVALGFCTAVTGRGLDFLRSQRHAVGRACILASVFVDSGNHHPSASDRPSSLGAREFFYQLNFRFLPLECDAADGFNPCQRGLTWFAGVCVFSSSSWWLCSRLGYPVVAGGSAAESLRINIVAANIWVVLVINSLTHQGACV
jgi:hypothetical protein